MSKSISIFLLFLWVSFLCSAQSGTLKFSKRKYKKFAQKVNVNVLNVVIENEKNPIDAALVNAVKHYWTNGSYQFISELEFTIRVREKSFKKEDMFLFKDKLAPDKAIIKLDHDQFRMRNNPGRGKNRFNFSYSLPDTGLDLKGNPLQGYYDLMIKYLNSEIALCKDPDKLKSLKKKRRRGIKFFGGIRPEMKNKDILFVKELVNVSEAKNIKDKNKACEALKKELAKRYRVTRSRIHIVFPEDISMALSKKDSGVLIYDGTDFIDPSTGLVAATSYKNPKRIVTGVLTSTVAIYFGALIAGLTWISK